MQTKTKQTIQLYWQHARKYNLALVVLFISIVFGSIVVVIIPLWYKDFFDVLANSENPATAKPLLFSILGWIIFYKALEWVAWRVAGFTNNYLVPHVVADLANSAFTYLHGHSFSFFNNNFVGSLVKRVNRFTRSFESLSDRFFWTFLPLVVNVVAILIVLWNLSTFLSLGIAGWIGLFAFINWLIIRYKLKYDIARAEAETRSTGVLADTITNHSNLKLFVGFQKEVKSFSKVNEEVRRLRKLTWDMDASFEGIQFFLMIVLEVGIFYLAIRLWQRQLLTVGDFVLIQAYLINIFMRVWDFGRIFRTSYEDLAEANEMTEILVAPHEITDTRRAKPLQVKKGGIEFSEVTFCYHHTRRVINELTTTIKPGERVALVGPSGAGKSTVIKLLLRLHDISQGRIFIDGQDIQKVTLASLWSAMSLVPQEPILFHRTLIENIRYGKTEATDEEVIQAAILAHCQEFINEFPEKYETYVGERGVKLSGGERQRVAIARAILRNAPILLLDEATSSLDSESEHYIQQALDVLMKGKTVIVIAHRLSTIMKMDRILVFDRGKIVEEGRHNSLIRKKQGLYKQLWTIQSGGFIE